MKNSTLLYLLGLGALGFWLYKKAGVIGQAVSNAQQSAALTVSDILPTATNTYDPNAPAVTQQGFAAPTDAPYWYDANGNPRTAPMGISGTVYDPYGNMMQILNASQRAAYIGG